MFVSLGAEGTQGVMCVAGELFRCEQCHNSVHQKCIDESVVTSMEARCPLCRAPFQHPVLEIVRANQHDGIAHYSNVFERIRMFMQQEWPNLDANIMRMQELPGQLFGSDYRQLFGYREDREDREAADEHEDENELAMEPDEEA